MSSSMPSGDQPAADPRPEERNVAARQPFPMMISTDELGAHPGNVREDLELSQEFCDSVAEIGVRVPLLVTPTGDGGYRVIEGHRRLAAAVKAGQATVPCHVDPGRADDEAGQYLDMVVANSASYRRNFTPVQEVAALFAAHEAGATRTRIRRATGRKAEEVKTALQAGQLSDDTRAKAGELASQLTLDQLALLAEFDSDQDAIAKILEALRHGYTAEYVAERIRQDRAEAAEHERLRAELEAAGTAVTSELPAGAARLTSLTHDGEDLTPETHGTCPGRGAYFPAWGLLHPVHYCAAPEEHGHAIRSLLLPRQNAGGNGNVTPTPMPDPPGEPGPEADPDRKVVIEGNKAWAAAAEVRKRWLQQLFARRSAPREVSRFVTEQLLTMPEPLRLGLGTAHIKPLFSEITGHAAEKLRESCASSVPARLPLLMLAPIAVAYEGEMFGADASRRSTWRTDKYSPCPRTDAGRYLTFLASLGYQLSAIEQAVANGEPYTGDTPAGPASAEPDEASGQDTATDGSDAGEPNQPDQADPADPGADAAA